MSQVVEKCNLADFNPKDARDTELIELSIDEKSCLLQVLNKNPEEISKFTYVLTPNGDIKKLPKGTTPVDFAYQIHTDIGNTCAGALVNGQMLALHTPLKNGDIVKIITQKGGHPSPDWRKFVVTHKPRTEFRKWYKQVHREKNIANGRSKLEKELAKNGRGAILKLEYIQNVARQLNHHDKEVLLAALGYGEVSLTLVINRLQELAGQTQNYTKAEPQTQKSSEVINTAIVAKKSSLSFCKVLQS